MPLRLILSKLEEVFSLQLRLSRARPLFLKRKAIKSPIFILRQIKAKAFSKKDWLSERKIKRWRKYTSLFISPRRFQDSTSPFWR